MSRFIRLHVIAEGETEERFVKDTLAVHLGSFNLSTDVRKVMTRKDKHKFYRGGLLDYDKAKRDIQTWLKEDRQPETRVTTMFDLYALPDNFPGFTDAKTVSDSYKKVARLEEALQQDIDDSRFIPYLQLYEFEALVLAKPELLESEYFDSQKAIAILQDALQARQNNAELINDDPNTAPSKRILSVIPQYDKVVGAGIAGSIGIDFLKQKCRHFGEWIKTLELLSSKSSN